MKKVRDKVYYICYSTPVFFAHVVCAGKQLLIMMKGMGSPMIPLLTGYTV